MISKISLEGIKSFIHHVDVPCGQLTVICGANSAGKSTILQALLLLKQTVESTPSDSTLRLSGALTNLGTAAIATSETPSIGIEHDGGVFTLELEQDINRNKDNLFVKAFTNNERHVSLSSSTEDALFDFQTRNLLIGDIYDLDDHWVVMRGITPVAAIRRVSGFSTEQRNQIDTFVTQYVVEALTDLLESGDIEISGPQERHWRTVALKFLGETELAHGVRVMRQIGSVIEETTKKANLPEQLAKLLCNRDLDLVSDIGNLLDLNDFEETLSSLVSVGEGQSFELVDNTNDIEELSLQQFTDNVLYLGPLREDPQLIHQDSFVTEISSIGPKGTHMVAYLFYRGQDVIEARLPDSLHRENESLKKMSLLEALNVWMRYLGMGSEVVVEQQQPYGLTIGLRVQPDETAQLLTNVGVGVSQVLPILTLGLVAERGQTLIYEQPELHLHPAIQSKLADFFLILSATGVQVIVETHSEHLINRSRLYVSRREVDPSSLSMIFVTRDEFGSSIESINIDHDGYLESWPDGFFDETEKALIELLR